MGKFKKDHEPLIKSLAQAWINQAPIDKAAYQTLLQHRGERIRQKIQSAQTEGKQIKCAKRLKTLSDQFPGKAISMLAHEQVRTEIALQAARSQTSFDSQNPMDVIKWEAVQSAAKAAAREDVAQMFAQYSRAAQHNDQNGNDMRHISRTTHPNGDRHAAFR